MNCDESRKKLEAKISQLLLEIQTDKATLLDIANNLEVLSKLAWKEVQACYPPSTWIDPE